MPHPSYTSRSMPDRMRTKIKPAVSFALLAVLAVLAFVVFVRLRLAGVPLERDEGEYAYAGRLILQGIPPYSIAYNMKFPGTYYAYAVIMAIFGRTTTGIHVGLLCVNAATILLVFALGRRLLGDLAGAVSAASFAILALDRQVLGVFAHATHFVILAAMAGLLVLLRAIERDRTWGFFWSGVLFGVAVLMKQHAIFYLPFAAALVFWSAGSDETSIPAAKARRLGLLTLGALVPVTAVLLMLLAEGVFQRFWFWTFQYASAYVSEVPLWRAWTMFTAAIEKVTEKTLAVWALGVLGAVALWTLRWDRRAKLVVTGLLVASALSVCPGFWFRAHYFILILPAIALLTGVAIASLRQLLETKLSHRAARAAALAVIVAVIGTYVIMERDYLFDMSTRDLSRSRFGNNPFIEAVEIAKYIQDHTDKDDRIAVMGSEPEIYFYADRKGATGYIYTYALMEVQPFAKTMQQEMIREIEAVHPKYLVFSWIDVSWMAQPNSDRGIVDWGRSYVRDCYEPVGVADIFSDKETRMLWDDALKGYATVSPNLVFTCRRKSDAACTVSR